MLNLNIATVMKKYFIISSLISTSLFSLNVFAIKPVTRQHLLIDHNWKFIQSDVVNAEQPQFDDSKWRTLNLPHDWSIEGEFKKDAPVTGYGGYLPAGIGWYRKHLVLPGIKRGQSPGSNLKAFT